MRVAYIVPCRDKEKYVGMAVRSVLNQTYTGMHIVLSDQGSTDGTLGILKALKRDYTGDNKISILHCPELEPRGMRGMNAHLDWIMGQLDEDVYLITSADDWAAPERTAKTVRAFEEFSPDMVLNALQFINADGSVQGITAHPNEDGFVSPRKCLEGLVGGSTAHSWTRGFYEAVGGFQSIAGFDCYMPFLATARNGAYFLKEVLHAYIRHEDPNNTGLEGVQRAADEVGKTQVEELMHFQVSAGFFKANDVLDRWNVTESDTRLALYEQILGRAASWTRVRQKMSLLDIPARSLTV